MQIERVDMEISYDLTKGNLSMPTADVEVFWGTNSLEGHSLLLKELKKFKEMYNCKVRNKLCGSN